MEECKAKTETKLSYDELKNIAIQMQQRAMHAEQKLNAINVSAMRLEYLFKVVDKKDAFPAEFVKECVDEIVDIIKIKEEESDSVEE